MRFRATLAVFTIVGVIAASLVGAEESAPLDKPAEKVDLAKILKETKCPMSGQAVNPKQAVAYKESKIFMCCKNCVAAFPEKIKTDMVLAAKANHQLVVTHQATQAKCGFNGKGKINKDTKLKLAGVEVNTCCKNCLGALTKMEEKEQLQLVFGKNFEKAFVVKAQKEKEDKAGKEKKKAA